MTTVVTPLTPPITAIFDRLATLNGMLLLLNNQLDNFENLWRRTFREQDVDINHSFAGFTLGISDLTDSPAPHVRGWYPVGSFTARGEEYLSTSRVLISRETRWTIAQGYEAFATFLKDLSAHLFIAHPELIEVAIADLQAANLSEMKDAVRRLRWSTFEFTKAFGRISRRLAEAELSNNRGICIPDWHAAFAEIRHAATHSNFLVKNTRLAKMNAQSRMILQQNFKGVESEDGYNLIVTARQAKAALEFTGEYSFLVFKCLSIEKGYEWDILSPEKHKGD
jgi:hypothetical protein